MTKNNIKKIIEKAGGPPVIAKEIRTTKQNIHQWRQVPDIHVLDLERLSGISKHIIRPDIFGESRMPGQIIYKTMKMGVEYTDLELFKKVRKLDLIHEDYFKSQIKLMFDAGMITIDQGLISKVKK